MNSQRFFQYISYGKWIAWGWTLFLLTSIFLDLKHLAISNVGYAVFLAGTGLTLHSLYTPPGLIKKDLAFYKNPSFIKKIALFFALVIAVTIFNSITLISVKHINPLLKPEIADQLIGVGYGCISLALGLVCELKTLFDRVEEAKKLKE